MAAMSFPTVGIDSVRDIVDSLLPLVSWKTLALVLALVNIKNLPFTWHVRLLYYLIGNLRFRPGVTLPGNAERALDSKGKPTHPVFVPTSIYSRTPFLETDYNIHKSNSTYFSDLDISRTALVTRLYSPGMSIVSKQLDNELLDASKGGRPSKKKASMYIALGSVYCTFKREIKPFELYEIQSKVAAWDRKWLYIISFFLRPEKRKGQPKTLFAVAISKYVVKKGRLTVPPERVLRASGFLPSLPEGTSEQPVVADSGETSATGTPASTEGITAGQGVDGSLLREVLTVNEDNSPDSAELDKQKKENGEAWDSQEWTWEMIEQERKRGLQLIEGYTELDAKLHAEWEA
ncbi:hypothetical protein DTO027B5_8152 [Paecilomyces variotii]|nr:hypothetical protein DTO169C6_802 [Paecilomyces variotii]KAJ9286379.1 hypothetical protein DTO021C3_6089 [Paecilomyces variotii]KAJ9320442.1 hypothetical protein DTO027B3_8540 [Paecilomyces variotii]KAJ9330087.1 hypothetical protein DTO027B5_8152 [Paecilomyces variotii]KAJ9394352.1 hypothetical protein DTO282F9_8735 [Paecilomyces variotii]